MSHRARIASNEATSALLVVQLIRSLHDDVLFGTRYARLVGRRILV